jgi:hypothetical protein
MHIEEKEAGSKVRICYAEPCAEFISASCFSICFQYRIATEDSETSSEWVSF